MADISNLTAEIETFVRTHDNDQEKLQENNATASLKKKTRSAPIPPARTSSSHLATLKPETSDNSTVTHSQTKVTIEKVPIQAVVHESHTIRSVEQQPDPPAVAIVVREKITVNETAPEETERRIIIDRKLGNSRQSPENNEDYPERSSHTPDPSTDGVNLRKFNSEKKLNVNEKVEIEANAEAVQSPPRIIVRKATEDWEYDEEIRLNDDGANGSCEDSPKTPISSEVEFILEHNTSQGGSEHNTSQNASEQRTSQTATEQENSQKGSLQENIQNASQEKTSQSASEQHTSQNTVEQKTTETASEHSGSQNASEQNTTQSASQVPLVNNSHDTSQNTLEISPTELVPTHSASTQNASHTSSKQNLSSLEHSSSQDSPDIVQKRDSEVIVVETVHIEAVRSPGISKEKPAVPVKKNFKISLEKSSVKSHESIVQTSQSDDVPELKIVESTDDLSSTPTVTESADRYKIRFVALKNFSPEPQRRDVELRSKNNQEFDVEDMDLPPAPPQRRRSVRDIIASINKSQSLLKINQKPNGSTEIGSKYNYDTYLPQTIQTTSASEPSQQSLKSSNDSINRKYSELEESERKMRKMIRDMEQSATDLPVPVVERFDKFTVDDDKSNDVFKKCVVRREKTVQSGSGASQDENRSSLEWNPLPKPRRSRNLTHELENGKI